MKIAAVFFIYTILLIGFLHPVTSINQDLGRHLATGNLILGSGTVPKINLFSYTFTDFPFINHHWLSEVFYSLLFKAVNFNGLLLINTLIVFASVGIILSYLYKKTSALTLLFAFAIYIPVLFERTDVRPEAFSFLFLSLFISILYKNRKKSSRLIFLLPLIEFFWVNMHIYFPIGIAVTFFFFLDSLLINKFNKQTLILGIIFLLTSLVTIINPNTIKGALFPLFVFNNYGYSIEENQNIFFLWDMFKKQSIFFFFMGAGTLWLILLKNFKKVMAAEWFMCIFFTILAITSIRNFPLFVLATIIPFVKYASNFKFNFSKKIIFIFTLGLIILFAYETQQIYAKSGFGFGIDKGAREGVDFFIKQNLRGPIFNNFDIGSYLAYRLYPKEKVFVDGRPEAYPASFFKEEYIPMQENPLIFDKADQKYKFNTIFFSYTDQTPWAQKFLEQIIKNKDWNLAYLDDFTVILTKNKNVKPSIKTDYSDIKSLVRLAFFFQNKNFIDEEIKTYQKILAINPNFCPAIYNLTLILQQRNDPSFTIFRDKFQKKCQ